VLFQYPHVELEETGPHLDMTFRRHYGASAEVRAQAMKQAKLAEKRAGKNQEAGLFKEKMGRLHMQNQDLSKMATAKMKGLFKGGSAASASEDGEAEDDDGDEMGVVEDEEEEEEEEEEAPKAKRGKPTRK
jgi:ribosome production factor 2